MTSFTNTFWQQVTSKVPLSESEFFYREEHEDYKDDEESCCISQFEEEIWSKEDALSSFVDLLGEEETGEQKFIMPVCNIGVFGNINCLLKLFLFFFGKNIDCIISENMDPETTEKEVNSYFTPWKLKSKRHDTRTFCLIIINNWVGFFFLQQIGWHWVCGVPWVEI